jgi:predicted transcriptional regulator
MLALHKYKEYLVYIMKKTTLTIRIKEETKKRIVALAEKSNTTASRYASAILDKATK